MKSTILAVLGILVVVGACHAEEREILWADRFDAVDAWAAHPAEGVGLDLNADDGAMRMDFVFRTGAGYAVARRDVDIDLPARYEIRLRLRGEAPVNHLEFKMVDESGENVWWSVRRDYGFPSDWRVLRIKQRHVSFAWGPSGGGDPTHIAALEVVVTAGSGGAGSVWVDAIEFVRLPDVETPPPDPIARTSSASDVAGHLLDRDASTTWSADPADGDPWIRLDLGRLREFGGIRLHWADGGAAYAVRLSDDGASWRTVREVREGNGGTDRIPLPESEALHVRVDLLGPASVAEFELMPLGWAPTPNDLYRERAAAAPRGAYPRAYLDEQVYWTVIGPHGGKATALVGETGAVEVVDPKASIEPFLVVDGRGISWAQVDVTHDLENDSLPIPRVTWSVGPWRLRITALARGTAGDASTALRYELLARDPAARDVSLVLALRPFQVNPPSQSLNLAGGFAPLERIEIDGDRLRANGETVLVALTPPDAAGASTQDGGDAVAEHLVAGRWPGARAVDDPTGGASALLRFDLSSRDTVFVVGRLAGDLAPPDEAKRDPDAWFDRELDATVATWRAHSSPIEVDLPPEARELWDLALAQLHYVQVNRAGVAIQPGTRSYARSWIRDGALTSSAMLRAGIQRPAVDFLEWYAPHQFDNGKIPCVVDHRGPDPVPEHDSGGEFVFLVAEVLRYTGDRELAERMWPRVVAAVDYLDGLIDQRRTPEYEQPELREFYGILPPSISHEGYAAKPMHSYWDDLFALRGFRDAVFLAETLGHDDELQRLRALRDRFEVDLRNSIDAAMQRHGIDYIPGCADLGDFDATSTTILLSPVGAGDWIPRAWIDQTFDRYWDFFVDRRDGADWDGLTPYELRTIGAFVRLGDRDRAHEITDWFLTLREPQGWMQWAEVAKRDERKPFFLGDLPHTWVGTDYVRSVLDMFLYEDRADGALVLGAGIRDAWVAPGRRVAMAGVPTAHGSLDFALEGTQDAIRVLVEGTATLPEGGIRVALGDGTTIVRTLPFEGTISR